MITIGTTQQIRIVITSLDRRDCMGFGSEFMENLPVYNAERNTLRVEALQAEKFTPCTDQRFGAFFALRLGSHAKQGFGPGKAADHPAAV
jgi:hypothetical protein